MRRGALLPWPAALLLLLGHCSPPVAAQGTGALTPAQERNAFYCAGSTDYGPVPDEESDDFLGYEGHVVILVNTTSVGACTDAPVAALTAYLGGDVTANVTAADLVCVTNPAAPGQYGIGPPGGSDTQPGCAALKAALNRKLNTAAFSCHNVTYQGSTFAYLVSNAAECDSVVGTLNRGIFAIGVCDFFGTQYMNDIYMTGSSMWLSQHCEYATNCSLGHTFQSTAPTLVSDRMTHRACDTCKSCGANVAVESPCTLTTNTVCGNSTAVNSTSISTRKLSAGEDVGIVIAVLVVLTAAVIGLLYYREAQRKAREAKKNAGEAKWAADEAERKADDPAHAMELLLGGPNQNASGGSGLSTDANGMMQRLIAKARRICMTDIRNYSLEFEGVLETQAADLQNLEQHVGRIQKGLPKEEPRQPTRIDGVTDTTDPCYYDALKRSFQAQDGTIFNSAKAVAAKLGLDLHLGPDKKDGRANDKVDLCYDDDYAMLKDLRRASIVCADVASIITLLLALEAAGIDIRRVKNRFDRKYNAAEKSAGYRDLQLNVCIPGTGLIWELQIHLEAIEKMKTQMGETDDGTGRTGHQRYVAFRGIMERITNRQMQSSVKRKGGSQAVQVTTLSSTAYAEA